MYLNGDSIPTVFKWYLTFVTGFSKIDRYHRIKISTHENLYIILDIKLMPIYKFSSFVCFCNVVPLVLGKEWSSFESDSMPTDWELTLRRISLPRRGSYEIGQTWLFRVGGWKYVFSTYLTSLNPNPKMSVDMCVCVYICGW